MLSWVSSHRNRRISNKEQTNVEVLFRLTISFQKAAVFTAAFLFSEESYSGDHFFTTKPALGKRGEAGNGCCGSVAQVEACCI